MCLPVNQLAFNLLPPLLALLAILNPQSQHTVSKRLNHFIPTNDTTPLTATPSTAIRIVIRAKSVLYVANLDVSLQTTQRMRRTREYINTSLILRAIIMRRITIIRRLLTSILI
jgi:L-cystine uptake protein TcyP (sodium:dicarboxylate symporter family)